LIFRKDDLQRISSEKLLQKLFTLFSKIMTEAELAYLETLKSKPTLNNRERHFIDSIATKYIVTYDKLGGQYGISQKQKKYTPEELKQKILNAETQEQRDHPHYVLNIAKWGSYKNFLKSKIWHEIRYQKLKSVLFRCEYCQSRKAVQVHHIQYGLWGKELPEQLLAICRPCHEFIHGLHNKSSGRIPSQNVGDAKKVLNELNKRIDKFIERKNS